MIYSGRPLRCRNTEYVRKWNEERADEIKDLTGKGIVPFVHELQVTIVSSAYVVTVKTLFCWDARFCTQQRAAVDLTL